MKVTIPVPDDFAARFGSEADLGRRALEALALEEYRAGRMSPDELRNVLGFGSCEAFDGFLRSHGIAGAMAADERDQDSADSRTGSRRGSEGERAAAAELVQRFRAFRAGKSLGGLSLKDLTAEGRR